MGWTHQILGRGEESSSNRALVTAKRGGVEFNREILRHIGGCIGRGEGEGVEDGEEFVQAKEQVHFDWVSCALRFEDWGRRGGGIACWRPYPIPPEFKHTRASIFRRGSGVGGDDGMRLSEILHA